MIDESRGHGSCYDAECRINDHSLFRNLGLRDPLIAEMIRKGMDAEGMVVVLQACKKTLEKRIEDLEAIAPKKIKTSDGKVFVWRCPDELIPEWGTKTP